jgi:PRTRC genetic system protein F
MDTRTQSNLGLCIPRLSPEIPLSIVNHGLARLFAERQALGLPTIYPDSKVHKDLDEVIVKNLKALGFTPNQFTEKHFGFGLHLGVEPWDYDGSDEPLQTHYVVTLDGGSANFFETLNALDTASPKLGEYLWYLIDKVDVSSLPGVVTPTSVYDMYKSFRLEDAEDDDEALEMLASFGYEEDAIPKMLPSAIQMEMGGDRVFKPRVPPKAFDLCKALKALGLPDAEQLSDLVLTRLPRAISSFKQADSEGPPSVDEYRMSSFRVSASKNGYASAIDNFLSDCEDDMASNGDPQDDFLVQRVGLNFEEKKPTHKPHDGLAVVAKLLNAYTAMDELVERLQAIPQQLKESHATSRTPKQRDRGNARAGGVRRTADEPALHQ